MKSKQAYEAPRLQEIGSFEQITQSTWPGRDFDANYYSNNNIPVNEQGNPLIAS